MVKTLTPLLEEAADRSVGRERPEQLHEGPSHREHGLLDTLGRYDLAVERLDPVALAVPVERPIQIGHRDTDMVEIQQLHEHEAKPRTQGADFAEGCPPPPWVRGSRRR